MSSFSRVLIATDLSRQSTNMTDGLTSLCPNGDTQVILAHVFEDEDDAEPRSRSYNEVINKLEKFRDDLKKEGYTVYWRYLQEEKIFCDKKQNVYCRWKQADSS